MSPEQATAEKDLTRRTDIYSLGVVYRGEDSVDDDTAETARDARRREMPDGAECRTARNAERRGMPNGAEDRTVRLSRRPPGCCRETDDTLCGNRLVAHMVGARRARYVVAHLMRKEWQHDTVARAAAFVGRRVRQTPVAVPTGVPNVIVAAHHAR
jgi:hypothetical protein